MTIAQQLGRAHASMDVCSSSLSYRKGCSPERSSVVLARGLPRRASKELYTDRKRPKFSAANGSSTRTGGDGDANRNSQLKDSVKCTRGPRAILNARSFCP